MYSRTDATRFLAVLAMALPALLPIENWPKEVIAGHDPQLERAVQEAMRMLKEKSVDRLMKEPPPTHGKQRGGG